MDTKQRILEEALTLFSEKGYANVYVGDIAARVGIKAPSLYKHYKSKQAIFNAILAKMDERFMDQAKALNINGANPIPDAEIYKHMSEEKLLELGKSLFLYYLHDDYTQKIRKMLTIEQFKDKRLSDVYMEMYVDEPLRYQSALLGLVTAGGMLTTDNVDIMTLHFYSPIYMLLTMCDRDPSREPEALKMLEAHIKQFDKLYGRKDK
ncbi:MAG: TetR/AcrR family transcriptional regulator [Lachnospiraceae bacterium]|nr:TetR/AcrR family transcriptional regulator [Lachnospiraceae bacterium]